MRYPHVWVQGWFVLERERMRMCRNSCATLCIPPYDTPVSKSLPSRKPMALPHIAGRLHTHSRPCTNKHVHSQTFTHTNTPTHPHMHTYTHCLQNVDGQRKRKNFTRWYIAVDLCTSALPRRKYDTYMFETRLTGIPMECTSLVCPNLFFPCVCVCMYVCIHVYCRECASLAFSFCLSLSLSLSLLLSLSLSHLISFAVSLSRARALEPSQTMTSSAATHTAPKTCTPHTNTHTHTHAHTNTQTHTHTHTHAHSRTFTHTHAHTRYSRCLSFSLSLFFFCSIHDAPADSHSRTMAHDSSAMSCQSRDLLRGPTARLWLEWRHRFKCCVCYSCNGCKYIYIYINIYIYIYTCVCVCVYM